MPFNGAGNFVSLAPPQYPAIAGDVIRAAYFNAVINDLIAGLTNTVTRDGQSSATSNLPMAGKRHTGVSDATASDQYASYGQLLSAATLAQFLQSGAGAVNRSLQSKARERLSAADFGAVADFATDNTAAVQLAINALPSYGGTVFLAEGTKFQLKSLTLPARVNLDYRVDDDTSVSGPGSPIGSGERVLFSSNSSYPASGSGGIVNERRFTAPFHPGYVIDVRKDLTAASPYLGPGQTMTAPVRASYNILDEESVSRWSTLYENYDTWTNFSGMYTQAFRATVTLSGIGTAQWVSVPAANTVITGQTSGAKGFLLSVTATDTTVLWFSGKFVVGEKLIDDNETTASTVTAVTFSQTKMPWLGQNFKTGHWSIGLPPGVPTHLFAVGGKIAATVTRSAGQYTETVVTNPSYVLVDNYEAGSPAGFEITYNTAPAAANRRLTLRNLNGATDRAHMGAVFAHCQFTSAAIPSTSSFNVGSITKNAVGDYTLNLTNAAVRADFSVSVSTEQPLQYAYVFAYTTSVIRIKIVTIGTTTLVDPTGAVHVNVLGGDI